MTVTLYGIRNCDTMKKARAWLDARGAAYTFHDYAAAGIDRASLERWARQVGWERLCNRAGTTFRKLSEAETRNLTERKALDLMVAKPSMIKRPVLVIANGRAERILVGFSPETYAEVFRDRLDMRIACAHARNMSRMVQIRNVPDTLHRKLKVRAANAGQTLSDYLLAELERLAARPTREEMLARIHGRRRVSLKTPAALVIREERDSA